jgi:hypothetical protein
MMAADRPTGEAELGGDVTGGSRTLADGLLGGRRVEATLRLGAVAQSPIAQAEPRPLTRR